MNLFVAILASTVFMGLVLALNPLLGGILAVGVIIGILIRVLYIVDDIHKVLITKEKKPTTHKNALERYLAERDLKEKEAQLKGE